MRFFEGKEDVLPLPGTCSHCLMSGSGGPAEGTYAERSLQNAMKAVTSVLPSNWKPYEYVLVLRISIVSPIKLWHSCGLGSLARLSTSQKANAAPPGCEAGRPAAILARYEYMRVHGHLRSRLTPRLHSLAKRVSSIRYYILYDRMLIMFLLSFPNCHR